MPTNLPDARPGPGYLAGFPAAARPGFAELLDCAAQLPESLLRPARSGPPGPPIPLPRVPLGRSDEAAAVTARGDVVPESCRRQLAGLPAYGS